MYVRFRYTSITFCSNAKYDPLFDTVFWDWGIWGSVSSNTLSFCQDTVPCILLVWCRYFQKSSIVIIFGASGLVNLGPGWNCLTQLFNCIGVCRAALDLPGLDENLQLRRIPNFQLYWHSSTYYVIQTMYYVTKGLEVFLIDALHAAWTFVPYMYSFCTVNTFNTVTSVTTVITLTIVTTIPCCNIVTVKYIVFLCCLVKVTFKNLIG